jgi:UPF0716 protein FxsA
MRAPLTLLAFLALPLAEIATFIAVGSQIGVAATLLLVLGSTVLGIFAIRRKSLATLQAVRAQARVGTVPEREIAHGALTVLGGILLIVPGLLTSAAGLLLLLSPVREGLIARLRSRIVVRTAGAPFGASARPAPRPGVVELEADEFARHDGPDDAPRGDSPWREIGDDGPRR